MLLISFSAERTSRTPNTRVRPISESGGRYGIKERQTQRASAVCWRELGWSWTGDPFRPSVGVEAASRYRSPGKNGQEQIGTDTVRNASRHGQVSRRHFGKDARWRGPRSRMDREDEPRSPAGPQFGKGLHSKGT